MSCDLALTSKSSAIMPGNPQWFPNGIAAGVKSFQKSRNWLMDYLFPKPATPRR